MSFSLGSATADTELPTRIDLLSSPNDRYEIAHFSSLEISVFRLQTDHQSGVNHAYLPISLVSRRPTHSHAIEPAATAVCIAWKPDKTYKHIFAVGFSNAKVILLNLSPNHEQDNPPYIHKIFHGGGSKRACLVMAWNPTDPICLAIGYPKIQKPDQSLRIWDITSNPGLEGIGAPYPAITTGHLNALSWVADSAQHLLYSNLSGVGMYDYSKGLLGGRSNRSKVIHGICTDSLSKLYGAGYCENRVRVWCLEDLIPHFLMFPTQFPVVGISWSTLRHCTLIVMTSYPEIYQLILPRLDLPAINSTLNSQLGEGVTYPNSNGQHAREWRRHLLYEKREDLHALYPGARFSFLPHPTRSSAIILLPSTQSFDSLKFSQIMLRSHTGLALAPLGSLTCVSDTKLYLTTFPHHLSAADRLRRLAVAGYGFNPETNTRVCRELLGMDSELGRLWSWINNLERELTGRGEVLQLGQLMYKGFSHSLLCQIQIDRNEYNSCDISPDPAGDVGVSPCWQHSTNRELCLRLLGWLPTRDGSEDPADRFITDNQLGKAVLQYVITDCATGVRRAIRLLQKVGKGEGDAGIAVMALAGYPASLQKKFWVETCLTQAALLNDPYLRLCVRVLYSHYSALYNMIIQEQVSANDKFVLACSYLQDKDLDLFRSDILEEIQQKSLIEGLFLTGLGESGLPIMQKHLSYTGDILTVCILSSLTVKFARDTGTVLTTNNQALVESWWVCLCDFLDQTRLWRERCRLHVCRNTLLNLATTESMSEWHIQCGFCGKRISGYERKELRGKKTTSLSLSSDKNVTTNGSCCPSCYKPLPRCVVCHRHVGSSYEHVSSATSTDNIPTDEWIAWCQSCGHWGHTKHLSDWFKENICCPSPGCLCPCILKDT